MFSKTLGTLKFNAVCPNTKQFLQQSILNFSKQNKQEFRYICCIYNLTACLFLTTTVDHACHISYHLKHSFQRSLFSWMLAYEKLSNISNAETGLKCEHTNFDKGWDWKDMCHPWHGHENFLVLFPMSPLPPPQKKKIHQNWWTFQKKAFREVEEATPQWKTDSTTICSQKCFLNIILSPWIPDTSQHCHLDFSMYKGNLWTVQAEL